MPVLLAPFHRFIVFGARLVHDGTRIDEKSSTSGKALLQLSQPAYSFLLGNEFHHAEFYPPAVTITQFPEGSGKKRLFDRIAKNQSIKKGGSIHCRNDRDALQLMPFFQHARPTTGFVIVISDTRVDDLVDESFCHSRHELPPNGEDKDETIGQCDPFAIIDDDGIDGSSVFKSPEIMGCHDRIKPIIIEMQHIHLMAGAVEACQHRPENGVAKTPFVGVIKNEDDSHSFFHKDPRPRGVWR